MQIVLNGQLKEWLNKHTETSFLLHPLVNAYYYCKRRIYTHTHTSRFFSLLFFVHRHTSTYKTEQNFHKMMMMQQRSNGRERNEKKRRILRSKNALIRKCCMHLSSLSMFYKHYRLPVLEARHLYVCTQVRDKTNKVKRRRERKKLLDVSLSPVCVLSSITQWRREELERRDRSFPISVYGTRNERWRKWSIYTYIYRDVVFFSNIRQWSVRLICPFFLLILNNVSHPMSGQSAHTYIHTSIWSNISISEDKFSYDRHAAVSCCLSSSSSYE